MPVVDPAELGSYLQRPVEPTAAELAIRIAEGWMRPMAGRLEPWPPDPVPEDVWAWALELAGIAYSNPQGLRTRTVGQETSEWGGGRRAEILAEVAARYGGSQPLGAFPPAAEQRW